MEKVLGFEDVDAMSVSFHHYEGDERPIFVAVDGNGLDWMFWIEQFMSKLKDSEKPGFSVRLDERGYLTSNPSQLLSKAVTLIRRALVHLDKHFPYHEFSPSVNLFMRILEKRKHLPSMLFAPGVEFKDFGVANLLNEVYKFVMDCWSGLRNEDYQKDILRIARGVDEDYRSLIKYQARLFNKYSRLVVVHLDLFYKSVNYLQRNDDVDSLKKKFGEREAYFLSLSDDYRFSSLVGYFWKIEYGGERGLRTHCFLFFDGSIVGDDIEIGHVCGEKWVEITEGRGAYWNFNEYKGVCKNVGLGYMFRTERWGRNGLAMAIGHLSQFDYFLRLKKCVVGRVYGKGVIKKAGQSTVEKMAIMNNEKSETEKVEREWRDHDESSRMTGSWIGVGHNPFDQSNKTLLRC